MRRFNAAIPLLLAPAGRTPFAGQASRRLLLLLTFAVMPACAARIAPIAPAEAPSCRTHEVAWERPADAAERSILDAWCVAVGPPVRAAAPAGSDAAADSLLVVAWNINVGGGDLFRFVDDLRAGVLTGRRRVEHFVLLVQEAFRAGPAVPALVAGARSAGRIAPGDGPRTDIVDAASSLGLHLLYVPSMRNGGETGAPAEDRGNAILATLPLGEPSAIELPYEAQRRVAISSTVAARTSRGCAWRLRVASVHLDHRSRLERGLASFGPARTRQAQALAVAIQGDNAVLGGDLNTWGPAAFEEATSILRAYFPDTPEHDGEPTITFAGLISRRIDHLLARLRSGMAGPVVRVDDAYGSDHHPVMGWIYFDESCH